MPHGSTDVTTTPILLLFHLEKVHLAQVLGSLLEHIEYRGSQHMFTLHGMILHCPHTFFLLKIQTDLSHTCIINIYLHSLVF